MRKQDGGGLGGGGEAGESKTVIAENASVER